MLDDSAKVEGNAFQQTSATGLIPTQFEIQLNIVPPDAKTAAVPAVTRLVSDASAAFDDFRPMRWHECDEAIYRTKWKINDTSTSKMAGLAFIGHGQDIASIEFALSQMESAIESPNVGSIVNQNNTQTTILPKISNL